jgi:hypothetical protein
LIVVRFEGLEYVVGRKRSNRRGQPLVFILLSRNMDYSESFVVLRIRNLVMIIIIFTSGNALNNIKLPFTYIGVPFTI